TDEQGRQVADSNYLSMYSGGLIWEGPLPYGEPGNRSNFFDLRTYIAQPPSGKFQLQAFYHNSVFIADERDVSGLIVAKSAPIAVIVDNPPPHIAERRRWDAREPLTILAAGAFLSVISMRSSRPLAMARRDLCWGVLIGVLAAAMWL